MDHDLELIIPDPGNIWKFDFLYFPISWKYWKSGFSDCLVSWKYGRRAGGGGRAAPGVVLCCLGLFLEHVSWNFRISWKYWKYDFSWFFGFLQKRRAPKFHAEWSGFRGEISHMRPIQGRKLKLFQTPISKWLGEIHLHAAARLHEDMLSLLHAAAWLHEDMFSFLFNILNTVGFNTWPVAILAGRRTGKNLSKNFCLLLLFG